MKKHQQPSFKQALVTAALVLLIVCLSASVAPHAPLAKASQAITVSPTSGPPGTKILLQGSGFTAGAPITIYFNGQAVTETQGYGFQNQLPATQIIVPNSIPYGTYEVKATNNEGSATAQFTVAAPATPTPLPTVNNGGTSGGTQTLSPLYTFNSSTSQDNGASTGIYAAVGVVVAILIILPVLVFMRNRNSGRDLRDESAIPTGGRYGRYDQSATPYPQQTLRYTKPTSRYQSSSFDHGFAPSRSLGPTVTTFGRTCPYCKKMIRESYNTCPYCYKKLR